MNKKIQANTTTKVVAYLLIILVFLGTIGFVFSFTNGFNEEFKTFYIEYGGESILSSEKSLILERGKVHRFDTKYIFNVNDEENYGYKMSIVSNENREQSFDFKVDGDTYAYYLVGDLTSAFKVVKSEDYFTIELPENITLKEVLDKKYPGSKVVIPDTALSVKYPFTLKISSYNDEVTYNIHFAFYISVTGVEFEKEEVIV